MRSYIKDYTRHIVSLTPEEAKEWQRPKIWGLKEIDFIPLAILTCTFLDLLQLFIPKLRLK